jgi:hypothetical protein
MIRRERAKKSEKKEKGKGKGKKLQRKEEKPEPTKISNYDGLLAVDFVGPNSEIRTGGFISLDMERHEVICTGDNGDELVIAFAILRKIYPRYRRETETED